MTDEITININGVFYTKDEIKASDELKKHLLKKLKYEQQKIKRREYSNKRYHENPEKYKKLSTEYMRRRYNNDPEFKAKKLAQIKARHDALYLQEFRNKVGRPSKYNLDEELNLNAC